MRSHINVGSGTEISIAELARLIAYVVGYDGKIIYDISQPDGTPRKLLETSKIRSLGWSPTVELEIGVRDTYEWFLQGEKRNT